MSRFVRASKYRHVFGQTGKKEYGLDNIKVTNSAWDTNVVAASAKYISVNWNASGGGAFAILPLPSPFAPLPHNIPSKLPDLVPLARSHTASVLDTDWSPFNDSIVASGGEDGKVMIWKVEDSVFEGWGQEGWEPQDFDPVARIEVSPRRVGQVLFHPTSEHVLATSTGEHLVKLWDLGSPEQPRSVLHGHGDAIQSLTFNPNGNLLVTTCRDRKIRIFDPRAGGDAVRVGEGHGGIKGARVVWMGDKDTIATTGFSKMSDRQVGIWEASSLNNVKMSIIDQTSGVLMPFWTDNNILFLAGKGDGNIRYFEWENETLFSLAEYKSSDPQRGMCFLPRRALNVSDCEIARAYKVAANSIEAIAFIVPRKADSFQSDIYPPAPSAEPAMTAGEFFSGKNAPGKYVSLENGSVFTGAASAPVPAAAPAPTPAPTRTASAPAASPAPTPVPQPEILSPVSSYKPEPTPVATPISRSQSTANDDELSVLKSENDKLVAELRESREKIRNLELQVESAKANARKAAALLNA
ncbi:Coronin-like protein crn1 [Steccherinum ochraceum]|uniref:Coronin n=1 Tax=Steccherinum ochraceum TaxID=92696 RepID=A0A4R0RS51_9APHY|nr:Coronin-like protein crn1 [Steccherinum ochraceum]